MGTRRWFWALTGWACGADRGRDENLRAVHCLDEEVDKPTDGRAGGAAPDDLQVEQQRRIERPDDDPDDVVVVGDPEDPRGDAGPRCDRSHHGLGTVDEVRFDDDLPRPRSLR